MKKICVCNQKGGSGKTTTTMLLAMAYAKSGYDVGIIDLDEQQGATAWLQDMIKLDIETYSMELYREGKEYNIILIDTPPSLGESQISAIEYADEIILVTGSSKHEIQSSQQASAFVQENNSNKARIRVLFTRIPTGWKLSNKLDYIAELIGLNRFKTIIPFRASYQYADSEGWDKMPAKERDVISSLAIELLS